MKSPTLARGIWFIVVASICHLLFAVQCCMAQVPPLVISGGPGPSVILTWFADDGVLNQLESSSDLKTYGDLGEVHAGTGNFINVTQPIGRTTFGFFRLRRLDPGSTTAVFNTLTGILTITGTSGDNVIVVSRDAAGRLRINNGAVAITGGVPTVANTTLMRISGSSGNDQIALDESSGALPRAEMTGDEGHDTLTGGSGNDVINGGPGNDTLLGKGGTDSLFGGTGDDTLTGGDGDDQVFGEDDADRMIWDPGDDTDLNEGGSGSDTVEVNGGGGAEVFTTTANGTRVRFDRLDPAPFAIDIGTSERLVLNANGGNDTFSATGNLAALIQITVDGGAGNDTINGSNGADILLEGDDTDFIDGQQGNDTILLGAGDDTMQWDPGDGSDIIEGQGGTDRLLVNGSAGNEIFEVSANGSRVRFTRNLGAIIMDLNGVETFDLNALGAADNFLVNNLAGTGLTRINANLAGTIGGSTGDGQLDVITFTGTAAADTFALTVNTGAVEVAGLGTLVRITTPEVLNDDIVINGLGGVDLFNIGPGVTALIGVTTNQ